MNIIWTETYYEYIFPILPYFTYVTYNILFHQIEGRPIFLMGDMRTIQSLYKKFLFQAI